MSSLFEEIDREKKNLPGLSSVTDTFVGKKKLNVYQIVALTVFAIGLVGGIFLGNMMPACKDTYSSFLGTCQETEFNVAVTLISWAITFLFSLFLYGFGHMIYLLESIHGALKK